MTRPLAGIRVLSLAEQYPGPYATLLLADLGADVVLVERPDGGDPARQFPEFFAALNRNKRSLAVDLKHPDGKALIERLVLDADVVLEGFRPGTMERLGLGHRTIRALNPRLVYASVSGFGQEGPYRDRPAHDVSYQAIAGLLTAVDEPAGHAPANYLGDLSAGLFTAVGVLTALVARERTSEGAYLDVSITDGLVSLMTARLVPLLNGTGPGGLPLDPGYGVYRCADGRALALGIAHEDRFWAAFCGVAGLEHLAGNAHAERCARREELVPMVAAALERRTLAEWLPILDRADVPFGPVQRPDEVAADPHLLARELVTEVPAADGKPAARYLRQPLRIDGHGPAPTRHAPRLGEHSVELLRSAGYPDVEIRRLLQAGAVVASGEGNESRHAA
jgi:crotonobetainyl-CoA:carnitine CoA-transferase CaiB-like acyl-CoA transferase